MLPFDIGKVCRTKIFTKKKCITLPASIMIKQRIMLKEIPEVEYIRYMRSQNSGSIHGENFHI